MAASSRTAFVAAVCTTAAAMLAVALVDTSRPVAQEPQAQSLGIQFHTFVDSRGVTVLSPTVDLGKDFTTRTGLRVSFGVDAITAASDSCARCHAEGANNARTYVNGSLIRSYGDTKLSIGGEFSKETFYTATTVSTSITRALNKANTTVAGGYSFSSNRPQLHPDSITEQQYAQSAYGTLTQTLSRNTILQLGYEASRITGYQTNPFLRTAVDGVKMVGVHPDLRVRQALTARLRQALPADTYLEADYRRYADDWDVKANTWSVGLTKEISPKVSLSGIYRRHGQQGASFYKSTTQFEAGIFTLGVRMPIGHP